MLRLSVIGIGRMGLNHIRVLNELKDTFEIESIGVYDVDRMRIINASKSYDLVVHEDLNDVLSYRPDCAIISVPTSSHYSVSKRLIEQGINVLIEKPISKNVKEAIDLIKLAERTRVILMVGHVERYNPVVEKLREVIRSGLLGDVVSVSAKRVGPLPPRDPDTGVVLDLGVHDIDVMRYVLDCDPVEVFARTRSARLRSDLEDFAILDLLFENGSYGLIETNWITPHKVRELTVVGTRAVAYVNYIDQRLIVYDGEWVREAKIVREEPLKRELMDFIEAVRTGREPRVTGIDGLKALVIATKALESSRSGKPVKIVYPEI